MSVLARCAALTVVVLLAACSSPNEQAQRPASTSPVSVLPGPKGVDAAENAEAKAATPSDAKPLRYVEVWTGGASLGDDVPLFVGIHGLGDRPESFARLVQAYPEPGRFLILAAPTPYGRGGSWFPLGQKVAMNQAGEDAVRSNAKRILATAQKAAPGQRPVVFGFSQGGLMSYYLADHHASAIKGAVPLSGWLPSGVRGSKCPPEGTVAGQHGDVDNVISIDLARDHIEALKARGCQVEFEVHKGVAHRVPAQVRRSLFLHLARLSRLP